MFKVFSRCAGKLFRRNSWRILAIAIGLRKIRILRKKQDPPAGYFLTRNAHPDPPE
mgnify:CR=1 FL=1